MATLEDIVDEYNCWILDMMEANLPEHRKYSKLLEELSYIEYKWYIPLDENRDIDAIDLRKEYLAERNMDFISLREAFCAYPRSVLEVMAALSRRVEIEITGEPGNDHIERWFWTMIFNLGLDRFDNQNFNRRNIDKIIEIWLSREFDWNGNRSAFPLRNCQIDQRKIDIYYQMQLYLSENYVY